MEGRNKKKKKKSRTGKKKRSNKASSSTSKRKRISQDLEFKEVLTLACEELKSMPQLSSIDDAFHLSESQINEIVGFFESGRLPTPEEYMNWDLYAKAFYLKMHSSCRNKPPLSYDSLDEQDDELMERAQPFKHEISSEEDEDDCFCRPLITGPFKFGYYSEDTSPDCIPYHLYLLVKEASDIMKPSEWCSNTDDVTKLKRVEEKIRFFCNYFHSHLPVAWKYKRSNASKEVASYDTSRQAKYNMTGYTPILFSSFTGGFNAFEYEDEPRLSRQEMIAIMWIIHSRETPKIWEMCPKEISFYCKICSCFRIDYHRLEAASEDDVCLMDVGLHP